MLYLTKDQFLLIKNYFGFYCKYANEVYNSLVDLSSYSDIIGTKEYDKLDVRLIYM